MAFTKATKEQARLRLAVFGPSGAGKTFTSLRVATGMGGRIALADSERRSARKYSDRFSFDVAELDDKHIESYCKVIREAGEGRYDTLIIDSLSHAWQELLQEVDKLATSKFRGNTWSAWSEGTPKQRLLIDTLLDCPCHVIATMRSKTDWAQETGHNGKVKPVKIGLAPEQGKGIEYEFDMLMELSVEHFGTVSKDRTGKYQDKIIDKPGEDFGRELAAWLSEGKAAEPPKSFFDRLDDAFKARGFQPEQADAAIVAVCKGWKIGSVEQIPAERQAELLTLIDSGYMDKYLNSGKATVAQ